MFLFVTLCLIINVYFVVLDVGLFIANFVLRLVFCLVCFIWLLVIQFCCFVACVCLWLVLVGLVV